MTTRSMNAGITPRSALFLRCSLASGVAVLAFGCGDVAGGAPAIQPVVRDSAGITIVENHAPLWREGEGWHVSAEPELEIGMVDGPLPYQLDRVQSAVRLPDGSIAIADGGSRQVRIFDTKGRHLRSFGGSGAGPGEFQQLSLARPIRGDSLAAWDAVGKRVTVFDREGEGTRTWSPEGLPGLFMPALGWFADGSVVLSQGQTSQDMRELELGEQRDQRIYLRIDPHGAIDTLAALPGREYVLHRERPPFGVGRILFGREAHATIGNNVLVAGESGTFSFTYFRADGAVLQVVRVAREPLPISVGELAAAREREMAVQRRDAARMAEVMGRPVPDRLPAIPYRETHPFFDAIELDSAGYLWVREPAEREVTEGDSPRRWEVFNPAGGWLGAVETPAGLRVTAIGEAYLLGIVRDELDVDHVRLYRLERRAR
jgi:hypothetical protein